MKSNLIGLAACVMMTGSLMAQKTTKKTTVAKQVLAASALKGTFALSLDVTGLKDKDGYFFIRANQKGIIDSAKATNNLVLLHDTLSEPTTGYLIYYPASDETHKKVTAANIYSFYLQPGATKIIVKDSLANAQIALPSKDQLLYASLQKQKADFKKEKMDGLIAQYYEARGKKDKQAMSQIGEKLDALEQEQDSTITVPFIQKNAALSPVALSTLAAYVTTKDKVSEWEPLFKKIAPKFQTLPAGQALQKKIDLSKALAVGQPAIDFTQNDTLDKPVSLKDFRGKYVLVDFWASWCGPCRGENPNVVAAYNKYKDKGFTILGVSFDQSKDSWIEAIHKDSLAWTQVSDLQYWNNAIGKLYGIQFIPQNVLVDPQGNIAAKNIRGEELQNKLAEIFK